MYERHPGARRELREWLREDAGPAKRPLQRLPERLWPLLRR
jgi:hypothetical protein